MPAINVLDLMLLRGVKCCIRLDDCVSFFHANTVSCAVRVGTLCDSFPVSSAPSVIWGFAYCCVKVRWRKPAGIEEFAEAVEETTEDRLIRRLRADIGFGRSPGTRARQFGFGAKADGVKERRTQEKETKQTDAAD